MEVPQLALTRQFSQIAPEVEAVVAELLANQYFTSAAFRGGPRVAELEEKLAAYCQARFAVAVASGTDALLVALLAVGVEPGEEVITTPFTFFATAAAVHRVGARPIFVDIDPRTLNLNPELVPQAVTERTRAILPVHLYGQSADMEPLVVLARERRLVIIEDAAQAVGAAYQGQRVGSFGQAACLSFYPTKNLGAYGEGGMVLLEEEEAAERARMLRNHGMREPYEHELVGFNSRMDELQAAVLMVKLRHLDGWNEARRQRATYYDELLADVGDVTRPFVDPRCEHVYHQYVIRAPRRDELLQRCRGRGIGATVFYPRPLHRQPCFSYLGHQDGDFPEAERAAREVVALPIYPELRAEEQEYVVETIAEFYSS